MKNFIKKKWYIPIVIATISILYFGSQSTIGSFFNELGILGDIRFSMLEKEYVQYEDGVWTRGDVYKRVLKPNIELKPNVYKVDNDIRDLQFSGADMVEELSDITILLNLDTSKYTIDTYIADNYGSYTTRNDDSVGFNRYNLREQLQNQLTVKKDGVDVYSFTEYNNVTTEPDDIPLSVVYDCFINFTKSRSYQLLLTEGRFFKYGVLTDGDYETRYFYYPSSSKLFVEKRLVDSKDIYVERVFDDAIDMNVERSIFTDAEILNAKQYVEDFEYE